MAVERWKNLEGGSLDSAYMKPAFNLFALVRAGRVLQSRGGGILAASMRQVLLILFVLLCGKSLYTHAGSSWGLSTTIPSLIQASLGLLISRSEDAEKEVALRPGSGLNACSVVHLS